MIARLTGEATGTALLLFIVVGSGIAAEGLTDDAALVLLAHALSVGMGLAVLIAMFQTISGSHFNPAVTLAFWRRGDISSVDAAAYTAAQIGGAVVGVVVANMTFGEVIVAISGSVRSGMGLVVSEAVGTFVLVLLILALVKTNRPGAVPAAVGAWVAVIIFATSSTGFANPAVTIARVFTDTYTGIAPQSVLPFVGAQVIAGFFAAATAVVLVPSREQVRQPV